MESKFNTILTSEEYISSYLEFIRPKEKEESQVIVYVEDDSDIVFWDKFFKFCGYNFKINTYFNNDNGRRMCNGKKGLLNLEKRLNHHLMIAIDADFDFIRSFIRGNFCSNKYIIHTHVYSRENIELTDLTLNDFFSNCRYNKENKINIQNFINELSEAFLNYISLVYIFIKNYIEIGGDFFSCFSLPDGNIKAVNSELEITEEYTNFLKEKLGSFIKNKIKENNLKEEQVLEELEELNKKGITKDNSYKYIPGKKFLSIIERIKTDLVSRIKNDECNYISKHYEGKDRGSRQKQMKTLIDGRSNLESHRNSLIVSENDIYHSKIIDKIELSRQ